MRLLRPHNPSGGVTVLSPYSLCSSDWVSILFLRVSLAYPHLADVRASFIVAFPSLQNPLVINQNMLTDSAIKSSSGLRPWLLNLCFVPDTCIYLPLCSDLKLVSWFIFLSGHLWPLHKIGRWWDGIKLFSLWSIKRIFCLPWKCCPLDVGADFQNTSPGIRLLATCLEENVLWVWILSKEPFVNWFWAYLSVLRDFTSSTTPGRARGNRCCTENQRRQELYPCAISSTQGGLLNSHRLSSL